MTFNRVVRTMSRWCIVSMVVLWCGGAASAQDGPVRVTVDPAAVHQVIRAWGATAGECFRLFPPALQEIVAEEAVSELGLTRLRLEAGLAFEPENDDGDPEHLVPERVDPTQIDGVVRAAIVPFKRRVEARQEPFELYVSPSFFIHGSTGDVPAWLLNSPGEYAEFLTGVLAHLRDTCGISANHLCICNEPGNDNRFTPALLAEIIRSVGPRLRKLGLPTRIEFPEAVNADEAWRQIQAVAADAEAWSYVGLVTYHLYGGNARRADLQAFAAGKSLPTGQTEFLNATVDDLFDDLEIGGVSYWEYYGLAYFGDAPAPGSYFSADPFTAAIQRTPQYWNFRQVMHYVRPGSVRIDARSDHPRPRALAFRRDGRSTVVLSNRGPLGKKCTLNVTGIDAGAYKVSRSIAGGPVQELGLTTAVGSDGLSLEIPADSMVTIYPDYGVNHPPSITAWAAKPALIQPASGRTSLTAMATDPEADPLVWNWKVVEQPPGSQPVLATPDAADCAVSGLTTAGTYRFEATVGDGHGATTRTVTVGVSDQRPAPMIVELGHRKPVDLVLPASATELRCDAISPASAAWQYSWRLVKVPEGSAPTLQTPTAGRCAFSGLTVPGTYTVEAIASDGSGTVSAQHSIVVHPVNHAPSVAAKADPPSLALPDGEIVLEATASDEDGDIITHWWKVKAAPAGAHPLIADPGLARTRVSALTVAGTYVFTVAVADRSDATLKDVTVVVANGR